MAGSYPDVPSWRLPYDRDGTQLFVSGDLNNLVERPTSWLTTLNDEGGTTPGRLDHAWYVFFFPRLMDLDAVVIATAASHATDGISTSPDTTNGADGTWTTLTGAGLTGHSKPALRNNIGSVSALGVRAFRFRQNQNYSQSYVYNVHMFGEPSAGENADKLQVVQTATDARVAPASFDFGNVPRGATNVRQFRIKNLSGALTANDIIVSFETLTDTTPSIDGQHTVSADQTTYAAQVNIGSLAPGVTSSVIDLRQVIASNAALGIWTGRVTAVAGSWT